MDRSIKLMYNSYRVFSTYSEYSASAVHLLTYAFVFLTNSVFRIVWHLRNKHEHEASEQLLEEIMTCIREIVSQLLAHYDMYKKHCKLDAGMLNANTFFKLQFTLLFLGNAKAGKAETGSMKPPCANTPLVCAQNQESW